MQFVPLSKIEDQDAGLQFVPLQFVPLAAEPTKAPAASASVAPSAPVAPAAPAAAAPVETAAGVLPEEAPTGMFAPRRDATFLGELGRGAKGAVEYGFPSMGRQIALQGSASAMVERQNQMALMAQIDQGQFKTLAELKNNPQYQALRKEGGDAGTVNAYFANRNQPEINAKLRGKVEGEMTKLAGDTAGHIKTLNQYARENKAKYGARVEKFTDINWADPAVAADFKDWLGYNMGAGAVQMAPIMLAAVIGKQPGLLATSAGMGVSEAVGNRLKFIQDQVKSLPPDQRGEAIAKYIAESGDTNLITGLVSGSFDLLLGPAAKAAKANLPIVIGKGVAAKQALKELPKDIGSEFVTGGLQQMTQIAAAKKLQEEGRAITWENIQDVINSAAAEAAGAPAGTAVNVGRAAVAAPSSAADALAAAIEADTKRAGPTTAGLRRGETLEQVGEEVERPFVFTPAAAPVVPPEAVAPVAPITAAPAGEQLEVIPGMPTGEEVEEEAPAAATQQKTPSFEPPVPEGFVRVYHSGSAGDGKGKRWASTDRQYASDYRADLPLLYTDIPANDPRVNNPDYPDQGVAQGFTFNFELTPQEATRLQETPRSEAAVQPDVTPVTPETPAITTPAAAALPETPAAPPAAAPAKKQKPTTFGQSDEVAPRVDSIEAFVRGAKAFTPKLIEEDAPLYTETNAEGFGRLMRADRQFEEGGFYVSDNPDLAIGQGENKGINVEFRPNSLSGSENVKPMTGLAGREYITNIRAPRAVAKVTLANKKAFDALDFATKTALRDEFAMQRQADGKLVFTRRPEFGGIAAPTAKAQEAQAEPGSTPDENDPGFRGASDEEVAEVASAFEGAKDNQEDEANTRVFDAPAKSEIVRIEQKAARSGVLTIAQAKKRIAEWKRNAQAQGETGANSDKIVLSLFDATGEWSKPWEEAGYQVFRFDIQTDPEMGDVNKFSVEFFNDLYGAFDGQDVYAILAACPCTDFAVSGARHFAAKDESGKTVESVELVYQTLRTVEFFKPSIWAIENPVGRIEKLTGLPPWRMSFNPNHFGDPYTKKTLLWGRFNADLPVAPVAPTEGSKMHRMYGGKSQDTKNARSVTPEGFAYAFFQSNNAVDNPVMAVANKYDMLKPAVIKQALDAGLTSQEISNVVDDPYYMDLDYDQAEADLKAAIKEKAPTKGVGAAVMGERMVNAADRFRKAAMNQFKLTQEQADAAMGKLLKEKILILDPVTGQFELKDGRFWNREVMMRAAGEGDKPFIMLENIEPTAKKLPPGRSPELAAAAQRLQRGEITAKEFDELVNKYKPIPVYFAPLKPATSEEVYNALDSAKREKINPKIAAGAPVGLRLDIPAFNRHGVFVVSIHEKRTASAPGKVIGYSSVASIKNVTFGVGNQKEALKIAAGASKDAIQTMEGQYVPLTTEQAYEIADDAILSGDWVQIGFDPTRHAYFFDRSTTQPVVAADEVVQIGNMILAKGVKYAPKDSFLYNMDAKGTALFDEKDSDAWTGKPAVADEDAALKAEIAKEQIAETRAKKIKEYAELRAKIARITAKVAKGEIDLDMQQNLARTMQATRELQAAIRDTTPRADTAEDFLSKALIEYKAKNISFDVLEVIQNIYNKHPELLDGLVLRVRKSRGRAAGAFNSLERMVLLYKGSSGIENPQTIRHELTHSLEQMMSDKQRSAVVQAWSKALQRAIKQNPDEMHQKYFQAILDFLENPSEQKFAAAAAAMPSIDMYQYINPSEFWAVNAEPLLASQLGGAWDKFKRFVKGLLEGLKNILGFDNRYAIHKTFSQVMGGGKERLNKSNLAQYVQSVGGDFVTLNSIEEEKDLLEKYSRPKTPQLDTTPILTFLTRQFKNGKEFFQSATENPREAMTGAGNSVLDGLIYLRNKNVWYGSGLEASDFDRYNGDLKTSEGMATASAALDNAIRSGNIGVEVIFRGGIKFDPRSNSFVAVETERGMRGVYEAEAALKKRLGKQLGTDIIQGYLEAKRSISIMNELYEREAVFETTKEQLRYLRESGADPDDIALAKEDLERATQELEAIKKAASSVNMSQEEMDEFAALDAKHPELRDIMDNWTAVNQNLLRFWRQVGLLSQGRYETLSAIKDYVPWYRIMNDEEDVHSPIQSTTRSMTNIGREKLFKRGKPISVVDVRAKEGQKDFKIQPSSVVAVEINGKKVDPDLVTATPEGNVRIDMDLKANDLVVFKTNREIENIIDNMTRNVMRMTMNGIRQYAANRIVLEYASRNEKNKIMVFPAVDKEKGRFNWMVNGKKVVVEIQDPLVAASIYGMENLNLQMWKPMAMIANLTRRSITLSGVFQIKQVFKDAPTAALVTGVKNPLALIGGVWKGFVTSLTNTDPVVDILKAAGIGGYMSPARTPEADIKRRLGIMNRNVFSMMIKGLDHIGDASDMAQRVATYKRVLAETGNEAQALYQAANVINFLHHGSAGYAQAAVKVVPFLGAYANATDVLVRALVGGGLKGMSRKKALLRLGVTTSILASLTLLYAMLAGGDPDYDELDDQTKLKNIIIPGTKIMLPMNTSAAYFFKAIPELIYNVVTREGTENEMDRRRIRNALADAARDMLLGPEPIPAGFKPLFEVAINHSFFTGRPVIPEGLKDVEAAEQYVATTSELGKKISAMLAIPGTDGKRVLSPIEADHIVRGVFGTSGAMAQWVSNSIGAMAETRPEPTAKEAPITGSFLREEVPRGREDLFYDFKEAVTKKHQTWQKMMDREDYDAADKYLEKHGDVVSMYEYVNEAEAELKEINAEIRRLGETRSKDETPKERRKDIEDFKRLKQEILDPVKELRRETFTK